MRNGNSIVNLGDLTKPATVLIEKISDAIGGVFKPYQIRRLAQAEAEADKIKALARIEIGELPQRALARFVAEEAKKQNNIESITRKAVDDLGEDSRPQDVEDDWISNFFDKCRLISDEEMQSLWAKVLAGEANKPGSYSRRTVNFIGTLDKPDAMLFTNLCSYGWFLGEMVPLVYDHRADIYNRAGINFDSLRHLDDIGLITFSSIAGYVNQALPQVVTISYYDQAINIRFKTEKDNEFALGHVLLSRTGQELAPICGSGAVPEFVDYVVKKWFDKGYITFSDWPNKRMHRM